MEGWKHKWMDVDRWVGGWMDVDRWMDGWVEGEGREGVWTGRGRPWSPGVVTVQLGDDEGLSYKGTGHRNKAEGGRH